MIGDSRLTYNVDIVFCIDCTESMDNVIEIVKNRAICFYEDLTHKMQEESKYIDQLRVRVIAFRDYLAYDEEVWKKVRPNEPMLVTDFFVLPDEVHKFEVSVKCLQPIGGGDEPEDGLEALAYAIRSDWTTSSLKDRHIIVLWSDQPPHDIGFARRATKYPRGMAKNFDELTEWWGDHWKAGCMPKQSSKRLILFAPDEGKWKTISDTWDNIVHLPSRAGDHLRELAYSEILDSIANTIS